MSAMISNSIVPADAGNDVARQDVQNKLLSLNGSKGMTPEAKAKKLREACEGFESIFIQKMWQEMRKTVPQGALLHGKEEKFWQDMYDQELAKKMTSAGGVGLADMMYEQLSRNLVSASRTTASASAQGRAFTPEPAPMLPVAASKSTSSPAQPATEQKTPLTASIYDGAAPVMDSGAMADAVDAGAKQAQALAQQERQAQAVQSTPSAVEAPIENAAVAQALAALRKEQHRRDTQASGQQVPSLHAMSPVEQAQMVRRDIGDKLGARGVRGPIKPQTSRAQHRTEQALARREKHGQKMASAPLHATEADSGRRVSAIAPQELERTGTVDVTAPNGRAGAGIAAYHAARQQAEAEAQMQIPPLSANDIQM